MTTTWLDGSAAITADVAAAALKNIIASPGASAVPGAYDGMSAVLAAQAGFEALYLSGAALSASMALPDLGMLTLEDVVCRAREIVRASQLPLIVDADTGYGEVLNLMRAVREFESVGVAGIQIEDQILPKKCGHLNDKALIPKDEMCRKIAAAKQAASSLLVCARTDAAAESLDQAIVRANAYAAAGADLIFVEALTDRAAMEHVRGAVKAPLLANMTEFGRTPQTPLETFTELGFEVVIYPVSVFRVTSRAAKDFYLALNEDGSAAQQIDRMMPRAELYETIGYYDYEALDSSIAKTVLEE